MFRAGVEVVVCDEGRQRLEHPQHEHVGALLLDREVEETDGPLGAAVEHFHQVLLHEVVRLVDLLALRLLVRVELGQPVVENKLFEKLHPRKQLGLGVPHFLLQARNHFCAVLFS